jgi:hypothetical protein
MSKSKRPTKTDFSRQSAKQLLERFERTEPNPFRPTPDERSAKARFEAVTLLARRFLSDRELDVCSWRIERQLDLHFAAYPPEKPKTTRRSEAG